MFSNREYYEMIRSYFLSGESLRGAQRYYEEETIPRLRSSGYPDASTPNRRTILAATQRLLDHGQFTTPVHASGTMRLAAHIEEGIFDFIESNPQAKIKDAARRFGVSHSTVWNLLNTPGNHPYKADESLSPLPPRKKLRRKCRDHRKEEMSLTDSEKMNHDSTVGDTLEEDCVETENKNSDTDDHDKTTKEIPIHLGFSCNVCQGKIIGFRYTCLQCVDWDLCASCEARGEHPEHYVLRLPAPKPQVDYETLVISMKQHIENLLQQQNKIHESIPTEDVFIKDELDIDEEPLKCPSDNGELVTASNDREVHIGHSYRENEEAVTDPLDQESKEDIPSALMLTLPICNVKSEKPARNQQSGDVPMMINKSNSSENVENITTKIEPNDIF